MLSDINSLEDYKKTNKSDLSGLSEEIRERIIEVMKKNGGHLASNLGTVELIMAIHYVFNSPADKIIFDVGHQSYTHKILTGRNKEFDTLRTSGGISGFTRRSESVHDAVDSGHASVSISQAVGFAQAMKLSGEKNRVISVIGDGALTGGEAFEGLNYAGHTGLPVIVILNDNEMSIGSNVGAVSRYFNKVAVSKIYQNITDDIEKNIKKTRNPFKALLSFINKMKKGVKMLFDYENVFTNLGFEYIGPIDGHNLDEMIYILERVKNNVKHPVLLHVKTIKGKGFADAECDPSKFHGVTPNLMNCGGKLEFNNALTYTDVFGKKLVEMASVNSDILAITAAMENGTGLNEFSKKFPDRFFDVGIAEQHAVSFAAALAYGGYRPFVAIYSTFLTRAIDQIIQDVCISSAPVVFIVDRAGIVGADGETHHGQFDITYLRMMPNLTVLIPFDKVDLEMALEYSYSLKKPVAIRYPRDNALISTNVNLPSLIDSPVVMLKEGDEILIIIIGPFVELAFDVYKELNKKIGIMCVRFAKPIPYDDIFEKISNYNKIVIIEENVYSGSVSEAIISYGSRYSHSVKYESINLPDKFIEHGKRLDILAKNGFNKENIINLIKRN